MSASAIQLVPGVQAQTVTATLNSGNSPAAIAVNPVNDRIYVANKADNTLIVIPGATNATATVAVGTTPVALAANPTNGNVYVANSARNNVTVVDAANSASTIAVGTDPIAIAVNPSTGKVYVVNSAGFELHDQRKLHSYSNGNKGGQCDDQRQ